MKSDSFILKGDLCWSRDYQTIATQPDGYLVCLEGLSAGVFAALPQAYAHLPLRDYSGFFITPGLVDLHVHGPQYAFRSLGMDLELLDWLENNVFPEEAKYENKAYAKIAYTHFVEAMKRSPNTRACVFATVHRDATQLLMDLLEASGLHTMVGKVNMDRNCPPALREASAEASIQATQLWLEEISGKYAHTKPILTPRFIPSCSDRLMQQLGALQRTHDLPVQSHLSENQGEVAWVRRLCPKADFYGAAYESFGLFGQTAKTIMAHCVLSQEAERKLIQKNGVTIAHCPQSNMNLASGIAPVRSFLQEGLQVGLGSDVAGGATLSIFRAMADAIQVSKLRWRLQDQDLKPLTVAEAFYLGTLGGGSFFGKVGSFETGYALDAVVLADQRFAGSRHLTLGQRLEQIVYLCEDQDVIHKYVAGRQLF